jgi:hypothetical protein
MGRLIYSLNVSLDGFVETPEHGLEWATVDDELHRSWIHLWASSSSRHAPSHRERS